MTLLRPSLLLALTGLLVSPLAAMLVPSGTTMTWTPGTTVGVPGGIPTSRTHLIDVTQAPYNADNTGGTDAHLAIQNAINAANPGDVIFLPAGTYLITTGINPSIGKSNYTVRGTGDSTVLLWSGTTGQCFFAGSESDYNWSRPNAAGVLITNGTSGIGGSYPTGATTLSVQSTTGLSVGQLIQIREDNDTTLPVIHVSGFPQLQRQLQTVTGISGNTITISPGLSWPINGALNPIYHYAQSQSNGVGFEDFKIDASNSTGSADYAIYMEQCVGCWVYNVHTYNVLNYHVYMYDSLECQIEHCYLDTLNHSGDNGSGLYTYGLNNSLVENNIITHSFPNIEMNTASNGNVIAYNFCYDSTSGGTAGASIDPVHAPHDSFNLFEGNAAPEFQSDAFFGSSSDNTVFRNWWYAQQPNNTHGATVRQPIILDRFSRAYNIVGNLLGTSGFPYYNNLTALQTASPTQLNSGPYAFGLPSLGNTSFTGTARPSLGSYWQDYNLTGTLTSATTVTLTNGSGDLAVYNSVEHPYANQTAIIWTGDNIFYDATVTGLSGATLTFSGGTGTLPATSTAVQVYPGPGGFQELDLDVLGTATIKGNYDVEGIPGTVAPGAPLLDAALGGDTMPNSMYLSGKPAWFGNLGLFPAYKAESPDPQITAGTLDTNGYQLGYSDIPAGYRFTHGGVDPSGISLITSQPANASVALGATAEFAVATEGTATTWQWQVNANDGGGWTNLTDGTSNGSTYAGSQTARLVISNASNALNGFQYQCVATNTNAASPSTSSAATLSIAFAPIISPEPAAVTLNTGGFANFTPTVSANPTATYQWQVSTNVGSSWSNLSDGSSGGATYTGSLTDALGITGVTAAMNTYEYRLVATNTIGVTDSSAAALTVDYAPSFSAEPSARVINAGGNISFTATVSANPAASYQWEVSTDGGSTWTPITVSNAGSVYSNYTTNTLNITGATIAMNGYEYELVATNTVGVTTSTPAASLTVNYVPGFTAQPGSQTVNAGSNTTLSATVTGNPTPTLAWQYSSNHGTTWTPITASNAGGIYSNYATNTLTITGATAAMNGYEYELAATNTLTTNDSAAATLTVDYSPTVATQPTSAQTIQAGGNATLAASITANPAASYQWEVSTNGGGSWTAITSSNAGSLYSNYATDTLTISQAPAGVNGNEYELVATNTLGSITTNAGTLTVDYAANFGTEPAADTVVEGDNATFNAAATANPNPTLQWQISTNSGGSWSNLSNGTASGVTYAGVTTNQLSITDAALAMNGDEFRAVATNSVNAVDSSAATLTVELDTPAVTSALYAGVTENAAFTYTITGTNTPTSFSASPVPAGLNFDPSTGILSGNPTTPGNYAISIGAINAHGTGTATLHLAVSPPTAPTVTSATSATVLGGAGFSYTITGTNFPSSYATTTLPAGLTLNANTGVISGTPTVGGSFQITLSATNPTGTGTGPLTITIETTPPPVITSPASVTAQVGAQFSYQIAGTNSPYVLTAIDLPPGLTVDSATGVISGIPSQGGTFSPTLQVTNASGTTSGTLTITVSASNSVYVGNLGGSQPASSGQGSSARSEAFGGSIAAFVNSTSTAGTLIGYISSIQAGFLVNFNLSGGAFTAQTTALTSGGAGQTLTFNGTIANGTLSGTIVELNLPFSAAVDPAVGSSSSVSGLYTSGTVYSVVGTQGDVYVLTVTPTGVAAGAGTLNGNGQFTVQTSQGVTVSASISSQSGISGSITTGSQGAVSFSGASSVAAPQVTPASQTVNAGATVTLSAATSGATGYQWQYYGSSILGATGATYTIPSIGEYQGGVFDCLVTTGSGTVSSTPATVAVDVDARLVNLSGRGQVASSQVLIAGFVVGGSGTKQVLLRGAGPTLGLFDVTGALSTPVLTLFDQTPAEIAANAGWMSAISTGTSSVHVSLTAATAGLFSQLGAFAFPASSADSAISAAVPAGNYSEQITGQGGSTGVALAEIWDADTGTPTARLANISLQAFAGTGQAVSTAGFVISGTTSETVLIRGIGPALSSFGISGTLAAPQLTLYDHDSAIIATNAGWGHAPQAGSSSVAAGLSAATSQVFSRVGAFSLPTGSPDCAMVVTLPPGIYTANVSGENGTSGTAMVEIYEVP